MNKKQREEAIKTAEIAMAYDYMEAVMAHCWAAADFRLKIGQLEVDILTNGTKPDDKRIELTNIYKKKEFNPTILATMSDPKYWEDYYKKGYRRKK